MKKTVKIRLKLSDKGDKKDPIISSAYKASGVPSYLCRSLSA